MNAADMTLPWLLWLDVETTGIDPRKNHLLEVGAILTSPSLEVECELFRKVLKMPHILLKDVDPAVLRMHSDNGLWDETRESTLGTAHLDNAIVAWLQESLEGTLVPELMLAGSSVHFDRRWAEVHFPKVLNMVSHRHFDLTSVKMAMMAWAPSPWSQFPGRSEDAEMGEWPLHRALTDLIYDIRVARFIMSKIP